MAREVRMVSGRWSLDGYPDPPDDSVVGTPPRRTGSVRRTAHLHATFPGGYGTPMVLRGRARDLVTQRDGTPVVRDLDEVELALDATQTVASIAVRPHRDGVEHLVGTNGFKGFRAAVDAVLPRERSANTPLAFLLSDVSALCMIGGIAWAQHRPLEIPADTEESMAFQRTGGGGIACSGLRPGGYHEQSWQRKIMFPHWIRPAGDLGGPDSWAWHDIEPAPAVCLRRRRRIDAWPAGDVIEVDAHFRDSVWGPDHDELALHEYTFTATIAADSETLRTIDVTSRVLPFPECPAAAQHAAELVGTPVAGLRGSVHKVLTELHACTHLNDMLRGLSDVPALAATIDGAA